MMNTQKIIERIKAGRKRYRRLVVNLRRGARFPAAEIERVLIAARRSHRDLIHDVFAESRPSTGVESGHACTKCGDGWLTVYSTKARGDSLVRYLKCRECGHKPPGNKQVVPAASVRPRQRNKPV